MGNEGNHMKDFKITLEDIVSKELVELAVKCNKLEQALKKARHLFECERDSQGMKICDEALAWVK